MRLSSRFYPGLVLLLVVMVALGGLVAVVTLSQGQHLGYNMSRVRTNTDQTDSSNPPLPDREISAATSTAGASSAVTAHNRSHSDRQDADDAPFAEHDAERLPTETIKRMAFGVPELVTRASVQTAAEFKARDGYVTASRDDRRVAALLAQMRDAGDPRLRVNEQHLSDAERWRPAHEKLCDNIDTSLTVADHHYLWEQYRHYQHVDIRDCAVVTPECLAFLQPEFNSAPHFAAWRKCCVEHRRLRQLLFWTIDELEAAAVDKDKWPELSRYEAPYYVTSGALLGIVRDGGALNAADTDVDLSIPPGAAEEALRLLRARANATDTLADSVLAPLSVDFGDGLPAVAVRAPSVREGAPSDPRDSHVELFFEPVGLMGARWDRVGAGVRPLRRCSLWQRSVWCPAEAERLLEEFRDWRVPLRTPPVMGLYGLSWCGDASGDASGAEPRDMPSEEGCWPSASSVMG